MERKSVIVVPGNILEIHTEATIVSVGPDTDSELHDRIRHVAGDQFHDQLSNVTLSVHGETLVAVGDSNIHRAFRNIIFVYGEPRYSLGTMVRSALVAALGKGYERITLPCTFNLYDLENAPAREKKALVAAIHRDAEVMVDAVCDFFEGYEKAASSMTVTMVIPLNPHLDGGKC